MIPCEDDEIVVFFGELLSKCYKYFKARNLIYAYTEEYDKSNEKKEREYTFEFRHRELVGNVSYLFEELLDNLAKRGLNNKETLNKLSSVLVDLDPYFKGTCFIKYVDLYIGESGTVDYFEHIKPIRERFFEDVTTSFE
jgi:hypothetical protein